MDTRYIYIPGLGDHFDPFRRLMLAYWRIRGKKIMLVPMRWSDKSDSHQDKVNRISVAIDSMDSNHIVLVGESAGGSMALRTMIDRPEAVERVVTICGYNHSGDGVGEYYRKNVPEFYETVLENDRDRPRLDQLLPRITSIYAKDDSVVDSKYSHIEGAHNISIAGRIHLFAIVRIVLIHDGLWR